MGFLSVFDKVKSANDGSMVARLNTIDRSQAVIEFDLDGTIRTANQNFLEAVGYELSEIVGRHHRMFVEPDYAVSQAYAQFWRNLGAGKFESSQYKRVCKGGKEIWIQATYNPILDDDGKPTGVIKFATDITEQKRAAADAAGQIEAIHRSQAVIEFDLSANIVNANDNFLNVMGYRLDEIRGRHHRIFVEPDYAASQAYQKFWEALRRGEFQAAEYKRIAKGGREVWIQATYNPIFDPDGKLIKIVKFATDITARKVAINELDNALQQLADGDLRTPLDTPFPGDMETLRKAFNQSLIRLTGLVSQLRSATREVENASKDIASGTGELSERTGQAALSLKETATSIDQMSATVRQNAKNAKNANQLADEANQIASQGGHVVEQAVTAMGEIDASAQKITDIIGVIDEIAFQTNLLALNASVEAARAGEAGKGFAVVAQEVRQLAQRSAQAALDIKKLIQNSNGQVKEGVHLVNQTGEALCRIVEAISKVAGIVREISSASDEQDSGVQEINRSVAGMDKLTQQNSAMVGERMAAARALNNEASKLGDIIAFFKISNVDKAKQKHPPRRNSTDDTTRSRAMVPVMAAGRNDEWNEF